MIVNTKSRDKGASFLRVFRILEEVAEANRPLTVIEISEATGLPNPTGYRLCKMLLEERLLQYDTDGRKILAGPRLRTFGGSILSGAHLNLERRSILQTLVEEINETCNISIPEGTKMVYAERVEADWPLRMQLSVGALVPQHCTASGKLYLSQLEKKARQRLLPRLKLDKSTPSTITDIDKLELELNHIRKQGYATDDEEFVEGLVGVAVPICAPNGRFCAGLAVHAPKFRLTLEEALNRLPALRSAANQIETLIEGDTDGSPVRTAL